ncbi:hypothetical protein [Limnoglobus roseus]|uniref:Uncharacterized protein n=1 Tax=Limnoglobus roseus TaxID=2598579 RepID=A0A5C1ADU3_9BACT|nr:hypothetical protein [Limnoglobus roseus]QEL16186.1 hypothetical protein PX52LOC_03126 [Limnoglobus roseus]
MSAFSDAEIIHLAKTELVPVCADDWYQRRRTDAEGQFFKKIVAQGRRGPDAETHQGIYVFTPDGQLLSFGNAGFDANVTRSEIVQGLKKWKALPAERRQPGAMTVGPHGPVDPTYGRSPPPGGMIVRVHARILDRVGTRYAKGTCEASGGDRAARDFLWLTADEVGQMAPAEPRVGYSYPLPAAVADRVLRFHLVDNTRGEPDAWDKDQVRSSALTLTVTAATPDSVSLRLDGEAVLATDANLATASRGYEVKVHGELRYRPAKQTFDEFDVAALGDHWGVGTFTHTGARPGRGLLGIAFGLADPTVPADRVAPQGSREINAYFGRS